MDKERKVQRATLATIMATAFLISFMSSALNLSVPNIAVEFHAGAALVGWVVTTYTLSVAAMSVPFGKVADLVGRRKFSFGVSGFVLTALFCIISWDIWSLLILRVLQGVSAAMIFATNNAILISVYPEKERGRVLGILTAAIYVGLSVGPVIGGVINHYFSWRVIFVLTLLISVATLVIAVKGIPRDSLREKTTKLDTGGNIFYVASIVVFLYGMINLSVMKYAWAVLLIGGILGVMFFLVESKAQNPVIRVAMFSENMTFTFSNLAALLNYGATFAIGYLLSIYLQLVKGFPSQTAGMILVAQPIIQSLLSPLMGILSDRIAPYKLASAGMALCTAALFLFSWIEIDTPVWQIVIGLILCGLGFSLFASPNNNAIMSCVEEKDYSVASAVLATMRTVGHTFSMAIVTIIIGMKLGNISLSEAQPDVMVSTMRLIFSVFVGFGALGVFLSMKRRKVRPNENVKTK